MELSDMESTKEAPFTEEQAVEEAKEPPKMPAPTATGNEKIAILKHKIFEADMERGAEYPTARLELAIRNVSDSTIATAVFEAIFYDQEGNIIDEVKHREIELKPDTSRLIRITTSIPASESDQIARYDVRLVRATTADVEKVQLRRYEIRTTETGEEEVWGVAKNISEVKTDAAVVVTFYDADKENIGTSVLVLRDIEPNTIRQFDFRFKPQEGDMVRHCSIIAGEIAA
jgi:hypothetical protein